MNVPIKEINMRLERSETTPIESQEKWYRTNRFFDWLFDTVPYGWRVYYRCGELRRWFINTYQRIRYGVSDAECWSLESTLTKFILPRLKHFKKINVNTHPADITPERWNEILDEIIPLILFFVPLEISFGLHRHIYLYFLTKLNLLFTVH